MTEVEAKKILDWLCSRWTKSIASLYSRNSKKFDMLIAFSERKWHMNKDSTLSLDFEFAWCNPIMSNNNSLHVTPELTEFYYDNMLRADFKLKTDAEFLCFLFKHNSGVFVKDWNDGGIYFIYPNESLEEIKVKMDLEDV